MINVPAIIDGLLADPGISAVLGNRVFFGGAVNPLAENFMIVNMISDVPWGGEQEISSRARLEMRLVAGSEETPLSELVTACQAVENRLLGSMVFGSYRKVYRITKGGGLSNVRDGNNRHIIITDFLFDYSE